MRLVAAVSVFAIAASLLSPAAFAAPAEPAPVAELIRKVDLAYEEFTLPNGLRVVVRTDRKAPVVAIQAWYNVGSKDEPKGRTGFAHLFEHIGLFNGTENLPGGLMEPLRAMGATDWNGTTWFDRTNFFQTVPTPAVEQALYMESDRMGHLLGALSQEKLDAQRGIVQNEKRQGDNQPFGLVNYAMLEGLFPEGHPYRHSTIGSMADLDAASMEDVRNWHRANYGPNNAVLVLAGDIDAATARRLVTKYFGHIPRGAANTPAQASVPTLPARVDVAMKDRVSNSRLYRAWAVPGRLDPDAADIEAATSILGGLSSSRLDNILVRQEQLAVNVYANYQPHHRVGIITIGIDVKPGVDPELVSRRLDGLLADYIRTGPTEDEVRRAATTEVSRTLQQLEPTGGFSGQAVILAEGALYANDPGHYRKELADWASVTPASVKAAMGKWLTRPVWAARVDPGEREAYQEAGSARPAPAPATPLPVVKRGPIPPIGQISNLDFPAIERARLSNGIEVVYARSATVPITRVAVEFDAGVAADAPDRLGAQVLLLNLLTEGAARLNSTQFAEAQERLGAAITAGAAMDRSVVVLSAPSPNLAPALDLMADVIRNPALKPEEIERLRNQQLAQINAELSTPSGMGLRVLPKVVYGEAHPYGRAPSGLGDPEAVKRLTRDDLLAVHRTWLRPDNATVFVTSDLPLAQLTPMLEARLGAWTAPATPKGRKAFDAPVPAATPRIILVDRPQSPQSLVLAGQVLPGAGKDDLLNLYAANEILANSFLSRINQDIRETRGWSYGVRGYIDRNEQSPLYVVNAPVQSDRTGESVAALLQHYKDFRTTKGVTAAELERTRLGNTRQLAGSFESGAAVLNALRSNALYGRPDDYWETVASRYQSMTAADLDAAARAAIDPDRMVWVIVGDAAKVKPQLDKLGLPVEVQAAK